MTYFMFFFPHDESLKSPVQFVFTSTSQFGLAVFPVLNTLAHITSTDPQSLEPLFWLSTAFGFMNTKRETFKWDSKVIPLLISIATAYILT